MTMRRAYVDTRAGQVHLRLAGERGRAPLVLLHQTASSSAMFEALAAELAGRFFVVAPDTPGFGASDAPAADGCALSAYAEPLYQALTRLELGPSYVFGHHSGTSLAVRIERDHPGTFRGMVLSGPASLSQAQRRALEETLAPVRPADDGSHLLAMWRRIRGKDDDAPLPLSQRETLLNLIAGETYVDIYRAILGHDFTAELAETRCPLLLVAGTRDTLHHALAPCRAARPDAQVMELEGTGTYVCDRAPARIAALIHRFAEEHP